MNETEVSATQIAAFETDLRSHRVKLLVYNSQASDTGADRMRAIAVAAGVPTVGATETEPAGTTYQAWIMEQLDALDRAVPGPDHERTSCRSNRRGCANARRADRPMSRIARSLLDAGPVVPASESKQSFFEKKDQKTSASPHLHQPSASESHEAAEPAQVQKFFASFFQKRRPCLLSFN